MWGRGSKVFVAVVVLALVTVSKCCGKDATQAKPLALELLVSDQSILVGDPIYFKLKLINRLRTTVLASGWDNTEFKLLLEFRVGKEEWQSLGDVRSWRDARDPQGTPFIRIGPEESHAIYGMIFRVPKRRAFVFDRAGDFDIRLRMHCTLGELVTGATVIRVQERPKAEMDLLEADNLSAASNFMMFVDSCDMEQGLYKSIQELRSGLHSGSLDKTLEVFGELQAYLELGSIDGKSYTFKQAFDELSSKLIGVRRDYVAMVLCHHAIKRNKLDDAAALLAELKEDSLYRRTLNFALTGKIKGTLRPMPVP